MWTATINEKRLAAGVLTVNVGYSNGTESFTEMYAVRSGPELNASLLSKINQLTALDVDAATLQLGSYTPIIYPIPQPDPKAEAISKVQDLKKLVDLGLAKDTDLQAAISEANLILK